MLFCFSLSLPSFESLHFLNLPTPPTAMYFFLLKTKAFDSYANSSLCYIPSRFASHILSYSLLSAIILDSVIPAVTFAVNLLCSQLLVAPVITYLVRSYH